MCRRDDEVGIGVLLQGLQIAFLPDVAVELPHLAVGVQTLHIILNHRFHSCALVGEVVVDTHVQIHDAEQRGTAELRGQVYASEQAVERFLRGVVIGLEDLLRPLAVQPQRDGGYISVGVVRTVGVPLGGNDSRMIDHARRVVQTAVRKYIHIAAQRFVVGERPTVHSIDIDRQWSVFVTLGIAVVQKQAHRVKHCTFRVLEPYGTSHLREQIGVQMTVLAIHLTQQERVRRSCDRPAANER